MRKKFLCLMMSTFMTLSISTAVNATGVTPVENQQLEFYSEEFPDAYIVAETKNDLGRSRTSNKSGNKVELGEISATVFVEEDENGSRLLSKEEVEEYGIENFQDLNNKPLSRGTATNSKGTLTITLSGSYGSYNSGKGIQCDINAGAKWSGYNFIVNNSSNPAIGEDYLGLTWGGGFNSGSISATAKLSNGANQTIYLADAVPNSGTVYSFDERTYNGTYLKNLSAKYKLKKNVKTGNGNTTSVVLKYIHTYQESQGSISITPSTGGSVAGSFSLSSCSKQWSIACRLTDLPY